MPLRLYLTHSQKLGSTTIANLRRTGWLWEHRPLMRTYQRTAPLPGAKQYILSSASAIKFLQGQTLPEARYWAIGPRTAEWAQELLQLGSHPISAPPKGPFSLRALVSQLPVQQTIWLGSAQGLLRHQKLWEECPWITPVITHWGWPNISQASQWDWSEPAHITCHCQNAATCLSQLVLHPQSLLWLSSPRLKRFIPTGFHTRIIQEDWLTEIADFSSQRTD